MPLFQVNTATTCVLLPATTLPGQPFEASVGCQWTGELKAAFDYKVEYETTGPTSCLARAVRFTDRSTGTPAAWSWRFPDGSTSSERSPVYVARPGSFVKRGEVVLVVSDGVHGDEALETLQIVDC